MHFLGHAVFWFRFILKIYCVFNFVSKFENDCFSLKAMPGPSPKRAAIVDLHTRGFSNVDIAKRLVLDRGVVRKTVKRFQELGSLEDRPKAGRPRSARTPANIKVMRERIRRNAKRSINQMAKELEISRWSAQTIVKEDLDMRPYRTRKGAFLSAKNKAERVKRCRALLRGTAVTGAPEIVF